MENNLDKLSDYLQVLIVFLGVILSFVQIYFYYKKECKNMDLQDKYYKNIVMPFWGNYRRKEGKFNYIVFLNKKIKRQLECVPPYLIKTIETRPNEIDKVMLYDYIHMRKNDNNVKEKIGKSILKIVYLIFYYVIIILCSIITIMLMSLLLDFIEEYLFLVKHVKVLENVVKCILGVVIYFVIFILLLFIINISISLEDQYTLKNKYIEKHIEQRIRWYDNNRDDFFI